MRTQQEVDQLVHENLGLVGAVVRRLTSLFPRLPAVYDAEDLYGLGSMGLVRAAQTYDPGRGAAFSTYAYGCIGRAITGALRREANRQIECIYLSSIGGEDEDNPLEDRLADPEADPASAAIDGCARAVLENAMQELPERQAHVIRAIYFEGDSVAQVAVRSRLSSQAVQNLHLLALKSLRRRLHGMGIRSADV
jgi:RNA polymerase sigma factor (sigma-70 family)